MSIVYIISAPSGSGKSTLVAQIRQAITNLDFSISYTTRAPRGSEQNGHEYFFVSREQFEQMITAGELLEHAEVFGNYYGTARRFVSEAEAKSRDLLLDIDVQGAAQIKQRLPRAVSIFVLPPSRDELERRLRRRSEAEGVGDESVIRRRLLTATKEIENWRNYDYILVNDRLEQSIDDLKAVVLGERVKRSGRVPSPAEERLLESAERSLRRNAQARIQGTLRSFGLSAAES